MWNWLRKYIDQIYLIEWYQERLRCHNVRNRELQDKIDFLLDDCDNAWSQVNTLRERCVRMGVDPHPNPDTINPDLGGPDPRKHKSMPYLVASNIKFAEGAGHD